MLKRALLHPIPSSRRHVIRVDIAVPVVVIRLAFWMRVFIKLMMQTTTATARQGYCAGDAERNSKFRQEQSEFQLKPELVVHLLHVRSELTQKTDKSSRSHGKRSIAPVGKSKFAVEHGVLEIN